MTPRTPSYRLHRPSGQAVVTLSGKDCYLGPHGSPESLAEYDRLLAEWIASGRGRPAPKPTATEITVAEVLLQYWRWAGTYYQAGSPGRGTMANVKEALKPVRRLYAHTRAVDFGPLALKAVRQKLVDARLARSTVNGRIGIIKRVFRWAVENELIPGTVSHALDAVRGLQRGRGGVEERAPVRPVSDVDVASTLPHLPPTLRTVVQVQRLTGMRPSEVLTMKTGELDRSGPIWLYRPAHHKTEHAGKGRSIPIGPRTQALLAPYLKADPDKFLFCPEESAEQHFEQRRSRRVTPMTPSQRRRQRKRKPKRRPGDRYYRESYCTAIQRACDRAGITRWAPNRLRHALATEVRRRYGLEASQVVLGHASANITQVYAARDLAAAVEVMREIG